MRDQDHVSRKQRLSRITHHHLSLGERFGTNSALLPSERTNTSDTFILGSYLPEHCNKEFIMHYVMQTVIICCGILGANICFSKPTSLNVGNANFSFATVRFPNQVPKSTLFPMSENGKNIHSQSSILLLG